MESSTLQNVDETVTYWIKKTVEQRRKQEAMSKKKELTPEEIKEEIVRLGTQYPNNQELGREVRKLINTIQGEDKKRN